jgi:putative toxin-antitoxin system antitoxin component (TIGR02293 family)
MGLQRPEYAKLVRVHYNSCAFAQSVNSLESAMSTPQRALIPSPGPVLSTGSAWPQEVNDLVQAQLRRPTGRRGVAPGRAELLSAGAASGEGADAASIRFSGAAAEAVVRQGLKAQVLAELADVAGIDVRHLYEFAGIDRTTVARRAARDDMLPHEASVKAMEFTELSAAAVDVFGAVAKAAEWLTRPHPLLNEQTPLQRARTPWGLQRVRAILGALKYGGAA